MKMLKVSFLSFLLILFVFFPFSHAFADNIILQTDGKVVFTTDNGQLKYFLFSHERFSNPHVLGASSGVTITVSLSSFIPTDTPTPVASHRPTATPTPTAGTSQPTATPTPHNTQQPTAIPTNPSTQSTHVPTTAPSIVTTNQAIATSIPTHTPIPTPSPVLIATITTPSTTTTQEVNQVTKEIPQENPVVLTPNPTGNAILLTQGTTQATTNLPVQINSETKTLHVVIGSKSLPIVSPTKVIQTVQSVGSYIIPSTIKINLTTEKNQPIYRITGSQHVQIFNTFIIDFPLTLDIAANTGTQIKVQNPFIVNLLEFLHIGKRVLH